MLIFVTALLLLVGLLLILYFLQGKLIFFPVPLDENTRRQFSSHEITINNKGVNLHGWFLRGEVNEQRPLLVYYGGNAEEVSGNLASLPRLGAGSYLLMNYRGYGDSGGQPSELNLLNDALYILDQIRTSENIDLANIVIMGRSLGTGVASYVASKRRVGGVVLVSPFDSLTNLARYHYPIIPVQYMLKHKFDSLSVAAKVTSPTIAIYGTEDQIVPPKFSKNLLNQWGGKNKSVSIEGANHLNIQLQDQYWITLRSFIKSLSGGVVL